MKYYTIKRTFFRWDNNKLKGVFPRLACLWAVCFFIPFSLFGQSSTQRLLGSFIFKNKVYNYVYIAENNSSYSFQISTPSSTEDQKQPLLFSYFSKDIFQGIFLEGMKKHLPTDTATAAMENLAVELFFRIEARLNFLDDEPITAYFILKKDNIRSFFLSNTSQNYQGFLSTLRLSHQVGRVFIEVEDGAIKNITAQLSVDERADEPNSSERSNGVQASPRRYLDFKNQYPISISGKYDPEEFAEYFLYCLDCDGVKGLSRFIKLADLMTMDIVLETDKEDYSPTNSVISLSPHNPIIELKKEKRSKILEVSAFTDFVGLEQEQPNGLIQIEASRKININTNHHLLFTREIRRLASYLDYGEQANVKLERLRVKENRRGEIKSMTYAITRVGAEELNDRFIKSNFDSTGKVQPDTFTVKAKKFIPITFSYFGSIEPKLLFSKLEENARYLFLNDFTATEGADMINPVELYRYQLASFGTNLNILRFSFPQLKFSWEIPTVGAYWYRVRAAETSGGNNGSGNDVVSVSINSIYLMAGTGLTFRPDGRWGISLGADYIWQNIWDSDFELENKKGLIQYKFDAFLKTSVNTSLFFRFRLTNERKDHMNNFTQIQLGYTLDIFNAPGASVADDK